MLYEEISDYILEQAEKFRRDLCRKSENILPVSLDDLTEGAEVIEVPDE